MQRKEILDIVIKNVPLPLKKLYQLCGAESSSTQKRIRRVLLDYQMMKKLIWDQEENLIKLHPDFSEKLHLKAKKRHTDRHQAKKSDAEKKTSSIRRLKATDDYDYIIDKYKIRNVFAPRILSEADELTPQEIPGLNRRDLKDLFVITIDGEDAKDLDDAVSLKKTAKGFQLGVHIADVSYYVPQGSRLDKEALKRANSFYLINKVVPMFPTVLSNDRCSLNAGEDKKTMSILIDLDNEGNILSYEIFPSLIISNFRMTYREVEDIILDQAEPRDPVLKPLLGQMWELARKVHGLRMDKGGIDFDLKEFKIQLDEKDEPVKVWLKERLESEKIIEEFMLLANRCVAGFLDKKGATLFRIHEEPSQEKISDFIRIISRFGHKVPPAALIHPRDIQKLMVEVKEKPYQGLFNQLLLRSMQQARYTTENAGHYGLGFEYYTHFTSPIRRYADLVVHRLIKNALHGSPIYRYDSEILEGIAKHISNMERVEIEAEREIYKMKSVRYMKGTEGKEYNGIISGISSFGMFVQLEGIGVEGLIRFVDLDDDYYVFNEGDYVLRGRQNKNAYTVGNKIRISIKKVNVEKGFLDLVPVYDKPLIPEK